MAFHASAPDGLKKAILTSRFNREVFAAAGDACLVGGYLRDLLLFGRHSTDIDYVVMKNLRPLVVGLAKKLRGTVVDMKKERLLRICLKDGTTLDFTRLEGDLADDLKKRDFTVNALAWRPDDGLIDPLGGVGDMRAGVLRGVSRENFVSDPVRLLRAYRFNAELSFRIDPKTRKYIRELSGLLRLPASERITSEFIKLLNAEGCLNSLKNALKDGILMEIIPLSYGKLERNIKLISKIDAILKKLPEKYHGQETIQGLGRMGLLRLEGLLIGTGKTQIGRFVLSRELFARIETVKSLYSSYVDADLSCLRGAYELFKAADSAVFDLLILSGKTSHIKDAERFVKMRGFLSGIEVMSLSGLKEGVEVGHVIEELRVRQFEGRIRNKRQAAESLHDILHNISYRT